MKIPILCLILFLICTSALAVVGTQALKLDGNHYVEMKDCKALNEIKTQLTLEVRIRVKEFTNEWMPIVYKGEPKPDFSGRSYTLWVNQRGFAHFSSTSENSAKRLIHSSFGTVQLNRWYHIAGVINTTVRRMSLYLDGRLVATCRYGREIRQSRLPLRFGWTHENYPTYGCFNGWIDEVRIWNCVRTGEQLRKTMNKPLTGKEPGLVGYWTFNDTTMKDINANQTHGTLKAKPFQPAVSSNRQQSWSPYNLGDVKTTDGKRVRSGRIYFSGIPPQKAVMKWVEEGKIRTIVNFLALWSMERYQRYRWKEGEGYYVFHFPYHWTNDPSEASRGWSRNRQHVILLLIQKYNQPIRQLFSLLAEDDYYPVFYYCYGGRARSRAIAALIYLTLGVPEDDILQIAHWPWVIHLVFQEVKRCGGIEAYLKGIGVTEEQIKAVRRNLLE